MRSFVAAHFVTNGSLDRPGELLALGAAKVEEGRLTDSLDRCAKPSAAVTPQVTRRVGLSDEDLEAAAPSKEVVAEFLRFAGAMPVVSHRVEHDAEVLRTSAAGKDKPRLFDLRVLARTVFPALNSHEPASLAKKLGVKVATDRSARSQAEATAAIWQKLVESVDSLPWAVLTQIAQLLDGTKEPLSAVFEAAARRGAAKAFDARAKSFAGLVRDYSAEIRRKPQPQPAEDPEPLDYERVAGVFQDGGLLNQVLPAYERREEQERMALGCAQAFNEGRILLAEAGTGVGKSMAYLVPSVMWARLNHEKTVVSTNTKNLQEQLYSKDLPLLARAMDVAFETALIKGRSNYLCVRKFLHLLREADRELDPSERVALLPLLTWFPETDTGDIAENTGFAADYQPGLWARVSTRGDECMGMGCRNAKNCFVRLARARAMTADVIVANHSVVFSEMGLESPVLPPYSRIVFDEAHNIENVATEHFARKVTSLRLFRIMAQLYSPRKDGTGRGSLANLRFSISASGGKAEDERVNGLNDQATQCVAEMNSLDASMADFTAAIGLLFGRRGEDRVRCDQGRRPPAWDAVCAAADDLAATIEKLVKRLLGMTSALETYGANVRDADALATELGAAAAALQEFHADLRFCVAGTEKTHVYWAECDSSRRDRHSLCAAPLDIGEFMREGVYSKKATVIFSSATLTVGDSFRFMRERLGLAEEADSRVTEMEIGTSFDFQRQSILGVMSFLPPPNEVEAFTRGFIDATVELLRATRGRSLVLFTSHRMLRQAYPEIKDALEPEGILVLGQGIDGDRSRIARVFAEDTHSVLLGTASFWEGVDVVGESLSCLVLAKLPFQVFTDPLVEGRCELIEARGGNAFFGYSVPSAVIRLKQGFGRLIRTRADRGVVVIGDKRILTKSYGRAFLKSLPVMARSYRSGDAMVRTVGQFLGLAEQEARA